MPETQGPHGYVLDQIGHLQELWTGVRDADADSVHRARIVSRRIRAALPIVFSASSRDIEQFRRVGRELGRVRELDATQDLLGSMQLALPHAAAAVATLRREVRRDQDATRRHAIKTLDSIDLRRIGHRISARSVPTLRNLWRDWRSELRTSLATQAGEAASAVDRAAGVYLPNRLHAVRIAVKKLRYTLEVALATGVFRDSQPLADFKKTQETLGQMHDLHMVRKSIKRHKLATMATHDEYMVLESALGVECSRLHKKYLDRRKKLLSQCDACRRVALNGMALGRLGAVAMRSLPAAALVVMPVAMWYLRSDPESDQGAGDLPTTT